ncbi:DUF2000 domain-containing protein [Arhodomonas sp. AD133]|uniref:DUF2000 domain-containing protein n=1 Tax=Arhodomonas sp. AD133 TaxID=3415009 RepID=UPI003EB973F3
MAETKCVFVLDGDQAPGILANAAAILAMSMGRLHPELIGEDLRDGSGQLHGGITTVALPVLKSNGAGLRALRRRAGTHEPALSVVDVTTATRHTGSYQDYAATLKATDAAEIDYAGIALHGERRLVTGLTGSLPLLR